MGDIFDQYEEYQPEPDTSWQRDWAEELPKELRGLPTHWTPEPTPEERERLDWRRNWRW